MIVCFALFTSLQNCVLAVCKSSQSVITLVAISCPLLPCLTQGSPTEFIHPPLMFIHYIRDFISIFSRRVAGFHRWAKHFELNLLLRKNKQAKLSSQPGNLPCDLTLNENCYTCTTTVCVHVHVYLHADG